jgi:hypothetical protein
MWQPDSLPVSQNEHHLKPRVDLRHMRHVTTLELRTWNLVW